MQLNYVLQSAEHNNDKCLKINPERIETNDDEEKSFYAALHATGRLHNFDSIGSTGLVLEEVQFVGSTSMKI